MNNTTSSTARTLSTIYMLLKQRALAENRMISSTASTIAKCMYVFMIVIIMTYLAAIAIGMSLAVNSMRTITAPEFLCAALPLILAVDFSFRFLMQQTPAQNVKPYVLLPLPRKRCIDTFIVSSVLSPGNLVWHAMIIPFCIMSVVFRYGITAALIVVIYCHIMILVNSQWYLIVRTLTTKSLLWWALPVATYAALLSPLAACGIGGDIDKGLDMLFDIWALPGGMMTESNPLPLLMAIGLFAAIVAVNRKVQINAVLYELLRDSHNSNSKVTARHISFLDHFGEIGQYIQLEIKMLIRNRNPRKTIIGGLAYMAVMVAIISGTSIYDSDGMTSFWCIYIFGFFGATLLVNVMGYEGNHISFLMVHHENILTLLRAKYIFYSAVLAVPFILMLPVVVYGKWSLYMLVCFAVYTSGFQYFLIMQMAVFNKITIPLNQKITGKNGVKGNYIAAILVTAVFLTPSIIVKLPMLFGMTANQAYTIMLVIGAAFVAGNKIWLRDIYNRMMKRKYRNIEGFNATV